MGIPQAPRRMPQIEVTFDIDANGIMNVSAREKATGEEQAITIQSVGGLYSEANIQKMDAELYVQKDQERYQLIDAENDACTTVTFSVVKSLNEHKDKLRPQNVMDNITSVVADLTKAVESENVEDIKQKISAAQQALMKIGEVLMSKNQSSGSSDLDVLVGKPRKPSPRMWRERSKVYCVKIV